MLLLTSCSGGGEEKTLNLQTYPFETDIPITIHARNGRINISNGTSGKVTLSGSVRSLNPEQPLTALKSGGLYIDADNPSSVINIELKVPSGSQIILNTYGAELVVKDFSGSLDVTSAAGNIKIENMQGQAVVRANRGDVLIESSTGEFHLPGNYGLINLNDVSGEVIASTIMGTICYEGLLDAFDKIEFETDHGPVEIRLDPASNVDVLVKTTTGVVDCVVPGLIQDGAGCTGQLGNGDGLLQVYTVSGEVDLKLTP